MKKPEVFHKTIILVVCLLGLIACGTETPVDTRSIPTDAASIATGQTVFAQHCSACHNFKQDGIGPQLGGLTTAVATDWIRKFIRDPQGMIASGDDRAQQLFQKFKTYMLPYGHLTEEEINGIIAYLHTQKTPLKIAYEAQSPELTDPIPDTIPLSGLVVDLELITQFPASAEETPLARITKLDSRPDIPGLFVVDLRGKLYRLQGKKTEVYLDMARLKSDFIPQPGLGTGFGSFAFHPDFARNGLLYTTHTEPPATAKADFAYADSIPVTLQWVLSEWRTEKPGSFPFSGTSRELLRINMVSGIHGVQEIAFNPTVKPGDEDFGMLYIAVGDGGSVENGYIWLADNPGTAWGKILRIDPQGRNSANGKYGIPPANPFVRNGQGLGEVVVSGFRNPHRITWLRDGRMLATNIGHQHIEALYLVSPGQFCGWPIREGSFVINPFGDMDKVYPLPEDDSTAQVNYPVAEYDHDEGNAISGGYEYLGNDVPELVGKFVFGDIVHGRLFYLETADLQRGKRAAIKEWRVALNGKLTTFAEQCGDPRIQLRFGRDHEGELYVLTKTDGRLYRVGGVVSRKS